MADFTISPITDNDRQFVARFTTEHWGSDMMVMHGLSLKISQQQGFLVRDGDLVVGMVTYHIDAPDCEITSLDSLREGAGIGSALIEAVKETARKAGCARLRLITTNDNTHALRFYQRRGFRLVGLNRNAVDEARKSKPEIPLIGNDGILIHDEIELEYVL